MGLVAAPLLAATLTRDPVLVAGLVFALRLPWLIFPLLTGVLVDRLDRRRAMGMVNAFRAGLIGTLGLLVLAGWASLPVLYAVFFLLGAVETLYDNAAQAIVPAVAEREKLEQANGRLYAAQLVNNELAGPPLGGLLFGLAAAVPFLVNAGAFAASAALVLALRGQFRPGKLEGAPPTTLLAEIREGVAWLWGYRLLFVLAVMLGVMNLLFAATQAILVLFAQDVLGLGSVGFGLLVTGAAVGGLAGSLLADRIVALLGSGRALILCVFVQAPVLAAIALSTNALFVGGMYALVGFVAVTWNVITVSLRQAVIPSRLFGRVNSVYRLLGWGGMSAGALAGGFLARGFGLTAPFWAGAGVLAVMGLLALPFVNNRELAEARGEAAG